MNAPDPAEMLSLMRTQQRTTQSRLVRSYTWLLVVWAVAWALGFGALWLAFAPAEPTVPPAFAWPIFGSLIIAAMVWSTVTGIRSASSGIQGRSQVQGAMYGWSWTIAMIGAGTLAAGVQRAGIDAEVSAVLFPGLFVIMVGVLYLSGGALWRSLVQYVLGIVMVGVAVTATFIGFPHHYLVYATVGPVAMLVVAFLLARGTLPHEPRARRSPEARA